MNILVTVPKGPIFDSFFPGWVIEKLAGLGDVQYNNNDSQFSKADFINAVKGKDVCITGWGTHSFDDDILDAATDLRLIAHTGGTVRPLVNEEVYKRGITVLSGNELYARSVAEGVLAYFLTALRDIPKYNALVHSGGWRSETDYLEGLFNKKVGLVGFGSIARHLLDFLAPFDLEIMVYSNYLTQERAETLNVKLASLEEVFAGCDIISVHSAQSKKNEKLDSDKLMSMIKRSSILVNTSRGSVVDEEALCRHLEAGHFRAVLDVFCEEPLPSDHPLRGMKNTFLIPHMGGPTTDRRPHVTRELAEDIERFTSGGELKHEIPWSYAQNMTIS